MRVSMVVSSSMRHWHTAGCLYVSMPENVPKRWCDIGRGRRLSEHCRPTLRMDSRKRRVRSREQCGLMQM